MKFKVLILCFSVISHISLSIDIFNRFAPPAERKELLNKVGIGSSTTVWQEVSSMYNRAMKYGIDTIKPNELYLTAKHAGQSPYAPLIVVGGGAASFFLGANTIRHGLCTLADLLLLRMSFVSELGKTLVWGSGTAIILIPTVIAGYTMLVASEDLNKRK